MQRRVGALAALEPIPFPPPAPSVSIPEPAAPVAPQLATPSLDVAPQPNGQSREMRMRAQATATDARAERLVRQVRTDVAALQDTLASLGREQDTLLEVDAGAVARNPQAAATLAPSVLVKAVVASEAENRQLRKRIRKSQARQLKLQARLNELMLADAARVSRLQTLEDVIRALHENLGDLRLERETLRQRPPMKLERPGELPSGEGYR